MQTFFAEPGACWSSAPLHTFALAEGSALIFGRAGDMPANLWEETFGDQAKDFAFYQLLERTMTRGFLYRYLVLVAPNGKPFALQPLIIVDQDLAISLGRSFRRALAFLRFAFPRLLRSRMLMAGCLVGEGHFGVTKNFSRRAAVRILRTALFRYADTEEISFLTAKDFPAAQREEMQPLLESGFTRLGGFPPLQLELNFTTFEHYLRERLSKATRKSLRRKLRAVAAARPSITCEVLRDCSAVIAEIYPLYLAVARRSEIEFEIFSREYFLEASLSMPERCRFFIWRQAGRAIAFSYCTVWEDTIFDHDLGLDYGVAYDLHLYYLSFRDILEWALRHGYRCYRTSPFNYEPKMHLRLELQPVDLFVRHRSRFRNFLLRRFAPHFSPVRSDRVLRRHFSALS